MDVYLQNLFWDNSWLITRIPWLSQIGLDMLVENKLKNHFIGVSV